MTTLNATAERDVVAALTAADPAPGPAETLFLFWLGGAILWLAWALAWARWWRL